MNRNSLLMVGLLLAALVVSTSRPSGENATSNIC